MPDFDELNATTQKEIIPRKITDLVFRNSPALAYLRRDAIPFEGGAFIQSPFLYGTMNGGAYSMGDTFNLAKPTVLDAMAFDLRTYYRNVTEYLEEISIENKGKLAVFSLINAHIDVAFKSMNANLAIDLYRHGQGIITGISDSRVKHINGVSEALNNGTDNSWDGNVFTTYGTKSRSTFDELNCTPYFVGNSDGSAGTITYNVMEERYQNACRGNVEPNLIDVGKAGYAFIKERIQPQQRFNQEKDPVWGVNSFRFNNAMVLKNDYCPSAQFGVNDPSLGNYLTSTFTSAAAPTAGSNLPAATTITVAELMIMWNTKQWEFRLSNDPLFQFGWTGFKVAQNSTMVAGQTLAALNLYCRAPWGSQQIYGFNS